MLLFIWWFQDFVSQSKSITIREKKLIFLIIFFFCFKILFLSVKLSI
jgi:hypothetical protein